MSTGNFKQEIYVLSVDAVAMLRAKGYQARRMEDGFPEWKASGLPVESLPAGED